MDYNKCVDIIHQAQQDAWVDRWHALRSDGSMSKWLSTLHPDRLPCYLVNGSMNGSYNLCQKFIFTDGTYRMLRFPLVGQVSDRYADEKVAMEVEAMSLIREHTNIPVPEIYAWGLASDNPLGLGPFILMESIEGVSAGTVLKAGGSDSPLMREDISDGDVEFLFRQIADIQLQLFKLDCSQIGSLPTLRTKFSPPTCPLTWKMHDILQTGGVDTRESLADRSKSFSTTAEYFQYVIGQDWEQLIQQPNSVSGPFGARSSYASFKILKSLMPTMVNEAYDHGPFKLICDDFGLGNLIFKSKDDLTIIGVIDLEWSYVGPAQLFASAPWWLLYDRPINPEWDYKDNKPPGITSRFFKYLEIYKRVMRDEESKKPGHEKKEFSQLVEWSQSSGAMWYHMILSTGFNDKKSFPFMQLQQHIGTDKWEKMGQEFDGAEAEAFAKQKVLELAGYDEQLSMIQTDKERVDSGDMSRDDFIAAHCQILTQSGEHDLVKGMRGLQLEKNGQREEEASGRKE